MSRGKKKKEIHRRRNCIPRLLFPNLRASVGSRWVENCNTEIWPPCVKFSDPLMHDCCWTYYHHWSKTHIPNRSRNVTQRIFSRNSCLFHSQMRKKTSVTWHSLLNIDRFIIKLHKDKLVNYDRRGINITEEKNLVCKSM